MENKETEKVFMDLHKGSFYSGDVFNGQKHGGGIYVITEKFHYAGEFRHDKFHGHGTLIYVV